MKATAGGNERGILGNIALPEQHKNDDGAHAGQSRKYQETRLRNTENPAFDPGYRRLMRAKIWLEESGKTAVMLATRKLGRRTERVVLIRRAVGFGKVPAIERWVNLGDHGTLRRNFPSVERPEMHTRSQIVPYETKPWNARVSRFRHRSLNVEMKDRFRAARPFLGQSSPAGIPHAGGAISDKTLPDEIDINIVFVGRPVTLEIVKERRPFR